MSNRILKEIDTTISKIAISVTDETYEMCKSMWKTICPIETIDAIEKTDTSIENTILKLIPTIKKIEYIDLRSTAQSYKCKLTVEFGATSPISPLLPSTQYWTSTLTSDVYEDIEVLSATEDELKKYSLSFALETLALIPVYLQLPLFNTQSIDGAIEMKRVWDGVYEKAYPDYYKEIYSEVENIKSVCSKKEDVEPIKENDEEESRLLRNIFIHTFFSSFALIILLFAIIYYGVFYPDKNPYFWTIFPIVVWISNWMHKMEEMDKLKEHRKEKVIDNILKMNK